MIQTNVIEIAWRIGVKRLLFLGSNCIYPKLAEQPIKEESLLRGPLEPTNEWYTIAKIAGIKLCESLRKQCVFDAVSLMPTNLYGPGDNYHLKNSHFMAAFIRRFCEAAQLPAWDIETSVACWGNVQPLREFLHVDDLWEACVFALEKWDPDSPNVPRDDSNQPLTFLNVGTGIDLQISELTEKIFKVSGFVGRINWDITKPDGTPKKQLDTSKINSLGWTHCIDIDDGIKRTIYDFLGWNKTG